MDGNTPADPLTSLMECAVSMHELFVSFVNAGFTAQQAIYLVGQAMVAAISKPTGGAS